MNSWTCLLLLVVVVLLGQCSGFDPLTSQAVMTRSVWLTDEPVKRYHYLKFNSLLRLPDNRLLIGAQTYTYEKFPMRLLSLDHNQTHMEVLDEISGDARSLALLSDGKVAITKTALNDPYNVYIVDLEGEGPREVSNFTVKRKYFRKYICCPIVGPGLQDDTMLMAVFDEQPGDRHSKFEIRSTSGKVLITLAWDVPFRVDHMAVFEQDIYISGESLLEDYYLTLMRFSLNNYALSFFIGDLDLRDLRGLSFGHGGFDQHGTFYVAVHNSSGCTDPNRTERTCCSCVMVITREGGTRVIQIPDTGFPEYRRREVQAAIATPSGFVVASMAYNGEVSMGVLQFFDLTD